MVKDEKELCENYGYVLRALSNAHDQPGIEMRVHQYADLDVFVDVFNVFLRAAGYVFPDDEVMLVPKGYDFESERGEQRINSMHNAMDHMSDNELSEIAEYANGILQDRLDLRGALRKGEESGPATIGGYEAGKPVGIDPSALPPEVGGKIVCTTTTAGTGE